MGNGIRSAAVWIRRNRLPVREVHDRQKNHNPRREGNDVLQTEQPERDEQRQRGFGAIRCGCQGIESEDRYTL